MAISEVKLKEKLWCGRRDLNPDRRLGRPDHVHLKFHDRNIMHETFSQDVIARVRMSSS